MLSAVPQVIESDPEFFAPASSDALDMLLGQYRRDRRNIETVADFMASGEMRSATAYFLAGRRNDRITPTPAEIFQAEAAVAALNASYWQRALDLTDVMDYMPDARRKEWHRQISEMETPEFEEGTVRGTLASLLAQRIDFLAEMVDGIFRGLSGAHVTNRPEGFGKRMIIKNAVTDWSAYSKEGLVHDLRCVVAKFTGRGDVPWDSTRLALKHYRSSPGEWRSLDGNALRVRLYKNGNAHLEVHPAIAWRLNQILAHLHPMAIPPRYRQRPAKRAREYTLMERPIPFAVLGLLRAARCEDRTLATGYGWRGADKHLRQEAVRVLEGLGGVEVGDEFQFDYQIAGVLADVLASGAIPDHKSHQFYPTPGCLAAEAVRLAGIGPEHTCLEPSAGQGAIADLLPAGRTQCVEVSELHCRVLREKGHSVDQGDFLGWQKGKYDRIVMNPPFSQGRARAHVEHAASMLAPGGRLVAILPASAAGKDILPGFALKWSVPYSNQFAGTSIGVVILEASV